MLYWVFKDERANSVDLDEVAHYELPHQDLSCLQIQLFSSLGVKELILKGYYTPSNQRKYNIQRVKVLYVVLCAVKTIDQLRQPCSITTNDWSNLIWEFGRS